MAESIAIPRYGQPAANQLVWWGGVLIVVAIFSRELGKGSLAGLDIDWIAYPAYVFIFIALIVTLQWAINLKVAMSFAWIILGGIAAKMHFGYSLLPFIKQLGPILLIYSVVGYIVPRIGVLRIFEWYIRLAYISAWIGLIQFFLKFFGYHILTVYGGFFIDSIAEEPSHYAALVLPALIYTMMNRGRWMMEFVVLLTVTILTFNLTAYTVFALTILIIFRKLHYLLFIAPVIYFLGTYLYGALPKFQLRIDSFVRYFQDQSFYHLHGTPLSFLSNLQVAIENVKANPIVGVGLGGHEESYYEYFSLKEFNRLEYLFGLNAKSAHSLTIRILSELGIIGFVVYLYQLSKALRIKRGHILYPLGIACLSHFLCKTMKLGNYFDLGTPFFFFILYFAYQDYKSSI